METIEILTGTLEAHPHILTEIAEKLTEKEAHELITVEEKAITIKLPKHIKELIFDTEIVVLKKHFEEIEEVFEPVLAKVTELAIPEALEILVETEHITFEEFKEVLFKITPETEVTKKLLAIFTTAIEETKEEKTTEKIHALLEEKILKLLEEEELLEKHEFLLHHFEHELTEFIETLKPEFFFKHEILEIPKAEALKKTLLEFLTILELLF